jgi:hypothetical protein
MSFTTNLVAFLILSNEPLLNNLGELFLVMHATWFVEMLNKNIFLFITQVF